MTIDKTYFLNRLANGEDMNAIGNELAAMMTEALNEHMANQEAETRKAAEAERELAKRDLVAELCDIVRELAILEGFDEDEIVVTDQDVNMLADILPTMFHLAKAETTLAGLGIKPHPIAVSLAPRKPMNDDEVIANFLKSLAS